MSNVVMSDWGFQIADLVGAPRRGGVLHIRYPKSPIRHRGFTLIEGLAAGVLLAAVGAVVSLGVSQSLRSMSDARDLERAAALLDATMTKIDLIGPSRVMSEGPLSGGFPPPDERFAWEASIESLVDGDLYGVTVTVRWVTPMGPRSAELATRLNDPAGSRDAALRWEDL